MMRLSPTVAAVVMVGLASSSAAVQRSVWSGVYTKEQAQRGQIAREARESTRRFLGDGKAYTPRQ